MTRMRLLKMLAVTTAVSLALQSCEKPAPKVEAKAPFSVVEASIPEMQAAMAEGRTTSRAIVAEYLMRMGLYEDTLNASVSVNANALAQADALDKERAAGKVRGPLHGIPVALKDNIMTKDDMPTSGGMLAFKYFKAPYDATLVTNLKAAGAIIIAKSTMSELAGWYGGGIRPGGYNGAAGQSYNPYDPRANDDGTPVLAVAGSSSGVGVAANLWAANVGTSTGGSIEGPSNANMLVGIRPSTGRISRYGIVPLSLDQDTAGPMTKFVADAAIMLGAMEGGAVDPNDPRTSECTPPANRDYTAFLKADALKGARIGIPRAGIYAAQTFPGKAKAFPGLKPGELEIMEGAIAAMKAAGAEIIDPVEIPSLTATDAVKNISSHPICALGADDGEYCSEVVRYSMKRDFNLWLKTLGDGAPVKTFTELLAWNVAHKADGAIRYGQERLEGTERVDLEKDKARYERNRAEDLVLTREQGLDAALSTNKLDALVFPETSGSTFATKAGYPVVVVPWAQVANDAPGAKGSPDKVKPYGFSFVGGHCEDPKVIGLAYAFEQTTKKRVPSPHTP
jgi:amidase